MSFSFNFDVPTETINPADVDGNQSGKTDPAANVSGVSS